MQSIGGMLLRSDEEPSPSIPLRKRRGKTSSALLLLGQGAVFAPARRASRVSPVEATRSV
jgi:hypothetical protein